MNRSRGAAWLALALAVFAFAGTAAPSFGAIVYNVTNYAAGQNGWTLAGTITVSGAGTFTSASGITAWNITATNGSTNYLFANDAGDPAIFLSGTLEATSSELLLNNNGYLSLTSKNTPLYSYLNWQNDWNPGFFTLTQYKAAIEENALWTTNTFSPVAGSAWTLGTAAAVPEPSAMALLGLGAMSLFVRRRRN